MTMRRTVMPLAMALIAAMASTASAAETFAVKRGIAMELWQTWPGPDQWDDETVLFPFPEWRRTITTRDLAAMADAGYDTIRLPVDPGVFLAPQAAPHRVRLIAEVKTAVAMIHDAGMKAIIDLHTIPGDASRPGAISSVVDDPAGFEAYLEVVADMARAFARHDPARTAFEPINEPVIDCDLPGPQHRWPAMAERLHAVARKAAPDLPLVMTGGCWGEASMLDALPESITDDPNTIFTFHSYAPFLLTHQGASWAGDFIIHVTGLPYPLDRLGKDELRRRVEAIKDVMRRDADPGRVSGLIAYLDEQIAELDSESELRAAMEKPFILAEAFAKARGIAPGRILLGEFGMIRQEYGNPFVMPAEWRIDYMRAVRAMAEARGFGWSAWGWSGAFGMVEGFGGEPAGGDVAREILR